MTVQNPNSRHLTSEDIARLKQLVAEGCTVMQEVEDLKAGLSDTVKAISDEVGISAGQLNKIIRIAYKSNLIEEKEKLQEIEDILKEIGRA